MKQDDTTFQDFGAAHPFIGEGSLFERKEDDMAWEITEENNVLKVAINGRFVAAVASSAREEILSRMGDGMNVLFDLGKMVHIDSSGLGVLVQVLQKAKSSGGKVVLAALQAGPKIVFDITKVRRVFEIVPTVEDAKFS